MPTIDRQDGRRRLAGRERAADLEERACLALARHRLLRPGPLERGELADDDPDEQQQEEVHHSPGSATVNV